MVTGRYTYNRVCYCVEDKLLDYVIMIYLVMGLRSIAVVVSI